MNATSLQVRNLSKLFGETTAVNDINFQIRPGEFITLLGPSGCGKTTILRMIAGFIEPDAGAILFDEKDVTQVPPHKRSTAMVFQSYALFPHMTVYENIRFGLRMQRVPENEQQKRISDAIELVNLGNLEKRKPYELSGGQQQRVALARALVVRPKILLFDEPLSNLDAKLREKVRVEIRALQKELKITTLYVTHDQGEALAISDRIFIMNKGKIEQIETPANIYNYPQNSFVADFMGIANIAKGEVVAHNDGIATIKTEFGLLKAKAEKEISKSVSICWRPEDMLLDFSEGSDNVVQGDVTQAVYMGSNTDVFISINGRSTRAQVSKDIKLNEGSPSVFHIPIDKIHIMEGDADAS